MSADDTLAQLAGLARQRFEELDELSPEMRLIEDLGLDSLSLLTLAVEAENHFQVCLEEVGSEQIATVGDLVHAIEEAAGRAGTRSR